jgi:hypothetical protein
MNKNFWEIFFFFEQLNTFSLPLEAFSSSFYSLKLVSDAGSYLGLIPLRIPTPNSPKNKWLNSQTLQIINHMLLEARQAQTVFHYEFKTDLSDSNFP